MSAAIARPSAEESVDAWSAAVGPTPAAALPVVSTFPDRAHFVFKKGHLGRYRFNLMVDEGRVGGDVRVATVGVGRVEKERAALLQMKRVAEALIGSLDEALTHLDQPSMSDADGSSEPP